MLTEEEISLLRKELETARNPFFIYDGDGDGLSSFLLLYHLSNEGKGLISKASPSVNVSYLRKVEELDPDKIFILDVPMVDQEFIDQAKRPIFWLDHHGPYKRTKIKYFNPKLKDPEAYFPTTAMSYQVNARDEDLWIATIGCLADWYMPKFINKFIKVYPHLLPQKEDLVTTIYERPIGKLVKMFFFLLKGPSSEVRKSVKILTRIKSPDEILNQETSQGKFLYKRFEKINEKYEELLATAKKSVTRSKVVLFYYTDQHWSFTANLANELTARYPKKVIIIARKKSGEMKCSLRGQTPILPALNQALVGVNGYGGGHPNACGAVIKEEDWERFLASFKEALDR